MPSSQAIPINSAAMVLAIDAEFVQSPGRWPRQCRSRTTRSLCTTRSAAEFFASASRAASSRAAESIVIAPGGATGSGAPPPPGTFSFGTYQPTFVMRSAGWCRKRSIYVHSMITTTATAINSNATTAPKTIESHFTTRLIRRRGGLASILSTMSVILSLGEWGKIIPYKQSRLGDAMLTHYFNLWLPAVGLVFMIFAYLVTMATDHLQARHWPQTTGKVIESAVEEVSGDS